MIDKWLISQVSTAGNMLTWKEFSWKILEKNTAKVAVLKIMQKSEIVGFYLWPVGLSTCCYTTILVKTPPQKSKTRVACLNCQNWGPL